LAKYASDVVVGLATPQNIIKVAVGERANEVPIFIEFAPKSLTWILTMILFPASNSLLRLNTIE
jgi:hypothetical protein